MAGMSGDVQVCTSEGLEVMVPQVFESVQIRVLRLSKQGFQSVQVHVGVQGLQVPSVHVSPKEQGVATHEEQPAKGRSFLQVDA